VANGENRKDIYIYIYIERERERENKKGIYGKREK
jgi:hypothetical protein